MAMGGLCRVFCETLIIAQSSLLGIEWCFCALSTLFTTDLKITVAWKSAGKGLSGLLKHVSRFKGGRLVHVVELLLLI